MINTHMALKELTLNEVFENSAPSNIALIKYMGKSSKTENKPTNSSMSYTLNHLRTYVRLTYLGPEDTELKDEWEPLYKPGLQKIELTEKGKEKFLNFFGELKKEFKIKGRFKIESANNFPSDCGLASSASSFAALTLTAHDVFMKITDGKTLNYRPKELAKISQKGSGSSCRSFFPNWALWHEAGAEEIQLPYKNLKHLVIICDDSKKSVSSSEAHQRVLTSDLFKNRPERATERLQHLLNALRQKNWDDSVSIVWNEFWDMHVLFHTSKPPFMYMNDLTMKSFKVLEALAETSKYKPMITMDAGSNVHLLFREEDTAHYETFKAELHNHFDLWAGN